MMRKGILFCGLLLLPGGSWADQPAPSAPAGAAASAKAPARAGAVRPAEDPEKFRAAMKAIDASNDKDQILGGMEALRDGFPASRPLLIESVEKGSAKTRCFAIQVLGEKGEAAADMKVVIGALKDSRPRVRLAAVMAIRRLGKEQGGLDAILEHLPREDDANNRKMAVKTLQHWGDRKALSSLLKVLKTEKDKGVRNFIVTALEFITRQTFGDDVSAWESHLESQAAQDQARMLLEKGSKKEGSKP